MATTTELAQGTPAPVHDPRDTPAYDSGYQDQDSEFSSDDEQNFHVDERKGRSWPSKLVQTFIKPVKPKLVEVGQVSSADPTRCKPSRGARKRCDVEEKLVKGVWTYELKPKSSEDRPAQGYVRRILYFAGGGWQAPPTGQHWTFCAEIVHRLQDTRLTIVR